MKKYFYILLAVSAALSVSCNKEQVIDTPVDNPTTGKTITFSASIDVPAATKASLDGLDIKWSSGDYIGICTDNDATIVAYPVTVDATDATICTITVNEVAGATEYYGIFRGSLGASGDATKEIAADDFTGVTFDTTTKTFSGLTVGNQQVASGSLSSYLWYTHGFPLSMAGKSSGTSLVMRPCLALFQVKIGADSVPDAYYLKTETYTSTKNIDHEHSYSAVRGFNLYQKGSSTIYSSGDYTVQVAADGTLTTVSDANGTQREYRQISQSGKLAAGTNYIMCLIPGGSINSFKFDFLGYSDNSGGLSWDAVYTMNMKKATTVKPGEFYDFGTLNPLPMKKAKNEADDEAADAAAASYVPAITIDGDLSDWDAITTLPSSQNSRIREWKFKSDEQYVYFYFKLRKNRSYVGKHLVMGFNTDNDESTGSVYDTNKIYGLESTVTVDPFTNASGEEPVCINGYSGNVYIYGYDAGESLSSDDSSTYVELSIPKSSLPLPAAGSTITIGCAFDYYVTGTQSIVLE